MQSLGKINIKELFDDVWGEPPSIFVDIVGPDQIPIELLESLGEGRCRSTAWDFQPNI